jgi:hypothetical protein
VANALVAAQRAQRITFSKIQSGFSPTNNIPYSLWDATGLPTTGTYGTVGKANGRTLTSANAGAMALIDPGGSETAHLLGVEITTNQIGTYILVDRIADVLLAHAETTGTITGCSATSRLPSAGATAEACQLWCEVQSVFSSGSNTITFTYTDQNGVSKTTQNIVTTATRADNFTVNANLWQPLAEGSRGVRSLDSVTLAAGTATGQYAACLVRPLATVAVTATNTAFAVDFTVERSWMPQVYAGSCLHWIAIPSTAVASPTAFGAILVGQG